MNNYETIPDTPSVINAANTLVRMIDGLGSRYYWATEGLRQEDGSFKPTVENMNMMELLIHIHTLIRWVGRSIEVSISALEDKDNILHIRETTLTGIVHISKRFKEIDNHGLEKVKIKLPSTGKEYDFWYMINGPIADVLTHVGQITSWRRINGNPVPKHSPFLGKKI